MPTATFVSHLFSRPKEFRNLLNTLPLGIAVTNLDKRIVCINRTLEGMIGLGQGDVQGLPCHLALRTNLCASDCPLKDISGEDGDGTQYCEGDMINDQRKKIPLRIVVSNITDEDGVLLGYIMTLEDMNRHRGSVHLDSQELQLDKFVGHCPQLERIYQILPGIAETDSSVLITGETGTGKDILAEIIHDNSNRSHGPFVKVNCGALPATLLESELFGHVKGAFTGADANKPGRFKLAHKGTLFLTEIGDLPLDLQVKLLSFLDDWVIYPLGSTKSIPLDVRIIAATHRDLQAMVQEGQFRQDLLYRLNVVRVHLPALRERGDDIRLLLDHFLQIYSKRFKKPVKRFTKRALSFLLTYTYPGNVRELKNIVEYAINICQGEEIRMEHIPAYLHEFVDQLPDSATTQPPPPDGGMDHTRDQAFGPEKRQTWPEREKQMILDALQQAKGRKGEAAALLGWGRSTLWRKMKHYEIE